MSAIPWSFICSMRSYAFETSSDEAPLNFSWKARAISGLLSAAMARICSSEKPLRPSVRFSSASMAARSAGAAAIRASVDRVDIAWILASSCWWRCASSFMVTSETVAAFAQRALRVPVFLLFLDPLLFLQDVESAGGRAQVLLVFQLLEFDVGLFLPPADIELNVGLLFAEFEFYFSLSLADVDSQVGLLPGEVDFQFSLLLGEVEFRLDLELPGVDRVFDLGPFLGLAWTRAPCGARPARVPAAPFPRRGRSR